MMDLLFRISFYFIQLQSCHGGTLKPGSIFCAHSQIEAPNSWKNTDVGIHSNNAVLSGNISASSPNLIVQLGI